MGNIAYVEVTLYAGIADTRRYLRDDPMSVRVVNGLIAALFSMVFGM